jgi:hypothetical protein
MRRKKERVMDKMRSRRVIKKDERERWEGSCFPVLSVKL